MVNSLITSVVERLGKVTDNRALNASTDLHNTLNLSFAMFHLKMPSLLQFRKSYSTKAGNLRRIYGVTGLPGDVAIRGSVDQVDTAQLKVVLHRPSGLSAQPWSLEAAPGAKRAVHGIVERWDAALLQ